MNSIRSCSRIRLRPPPLPQRTALFHTTRPAAAAQDAGAPAGSPHGSRPPLRMAVIGSGPAGFYTAYRVMGKLPETRVDMYEALPVPFGLVRFGVAPDHPEVKNCQDKFAEVAAAPGFRFVGNVAVAPHNAHNPHGGAVPLAALARHYDAVVFAYGASRDRRLGIPGEDLRGVYGARDFVGWYNGLPDADVAAAAAAADGSHAVPLRRTIAEDLADTDTAVVIGQGNVALDVARVLLADVDALRATDMSDAAVAALATSRVRRVHIVGRRGPMQAAFTIKEVRELVRLPAVAMHPVDAALLPPDLKALPRARRRLLDVVAKGSDVAPGQAPRSWSLDFCLAPSAFRPAEEGRSEEASAAVGAAARLATASFRRTRLADPMDPNTTAELLAAGDDDDDDGHYRVDLPAGLVFRSIGYRSEALAGFDELGIPFDERRGVLRNDGLGRVLRDVRHADGAMASAPHPGFYCAGWVKRGPTGVIASTMEDAFATADAIVRDWQTGAAFLRGRPDGAAAAAGWDGVCSEVDMAGARVVSWEDWQRIDRAEQEQGKALGKPRNKLIRTEDMLAVLG